MALWTWAFVNRFGLYGIVAERPRKAKQVREPKPEKSPRESRQSRFSRVRKQKEPEPIPDSPIPSIDPATASSTANQPAASQARRTSKPWSTPAETEPELSQDDEEVVPAGADEPEANAEDGRQPATESSSEPAKEADPASIPAAPWNRRKQQRR
jgi:hypothetical protein